MGGAVRVYGNKIVTLQSQGQATNLLALRGPKSTLLFGAHPLVERFNAENGTSLRVISHRIADTALNIRNMWRNPASGTAFSTDVVITREEIGEIRELLDSVKFFPVDASIAYPRGGARLGKEIVFSPEGGPKVVLATGRYEGEKNIALVAMGLSGKDFRKERSSVILDIPDDRLIPVPAFPRHEDWYPPHERTGIPHGRALSAVRPTARYLHLNGSSYVGLLVRSLHADVIGGGEQGVFARYEPSSELGVMAAVPEADLAKITSLLAQTPPQPIEKNPEKKPEKRTVIEIPGISPDELEALFERFTEKLETLLPALAGQATEDSRVDAGVGNADPLAALRSGVTRFLQPLHGNEGNLILAICIRMALQSWWRERKARKKS